MKALLLLALSATVHAAPPNVIILYADDWRFDTLSCAGNPVVKTPNIDALAKDGFRFTHGCVTTAICGVSESAGINRLGNENERVLQRTASH